jgi:hypothetical protein
MRSCRFYLSLIFCLCFVPAFAFADEVNCKDYFVNTNNGFLNGAKFMEEDISAKSAQTTDDCKRRYTFYNGNTYEGASNYGQREIEVSKDLNEYYQQYYTNCSIVGNCPDSIMEGIMDGKILILDSYEGLNFQMEKDAEKLEERDAAYSEINEHIRSTLGTNPQYSNYKPLIDGLCTSSGEEASVADMQKCSRAKDIIEIMEGEKKGAEGVFLGIKTISAQHKAKLEQACSGGYTSDACQQAVSEVADSMVKGEGVYDKGGNSILQDAAEQVGQMQGSVAQQLLKNNGVSDAQLAPIIGGMKIQLQEMLDKDPENTDIQNALNLLTSGDTTTAREILHLASLSEEDYNYNLEGLSDDKKVSLSGISSATRNVLNSAYLDQVAVNSIHETNLLNSKTASQYSGTRYQKNLAKYKQQNAGCWFCPIFAKAFQAINNISTQIYNKLKEPILPVLSVGLALWIAFLVLKFFSSFQGMDPGQFFNSFSRGIFKGFIAATLLAAGPSFIFGYTLTPILELGGGFSQKIIESDTDFTTYSDTDLGLSSYNPCSKVTLSPSDFPTGSAFSYSAFQQLDCMLRTASWRVIGGMAVGSTIVSIVFEDSNIFSFFSNLDILIMGCLIWLGHFVVLIILPLKLIDILANIAFVGALMPLLIVTWVFQTWKDSYAKKAFNVFMGASFTFIMLSLLLILSLRIITFAIPTTQNCKKAEAGAMSCPAGEKKGLLNAVKEDAVLGDLKKEIDFTGMQIFVTLGSCFFAWKLLGTASGLASELTGFSDSGADLQHAVNKPVMATTRIAGGAVGSVGGSALLFGSHKIKNAWESRKISSSRKSAGTKTQPTGSSGSSSGGPSGGSSGGFSGGP